MNHLAALEAQALANTQKIAHLSRQKHLLTTENTRQEELLAKYRKDFDDDPEQDSSRAPSSPYASRSLHEHGHLTGRSVQPPGPLPTPFYIAVREARHVQLGFVIPGCKGETLDVDVNNVDLAFILQQTLQRRGWGELMVRQGVEDFLEKSMMRVMWRGREGEIGLLA